MNYKHLAGLHETLDLFDAYFIDVWGVIHDGYQPYPYVVNCINKLQNLGKTVCIVSNMPRPGDIVKQKLHTFGIYTDKIHFVTSGDVVRQQLAVNNKIYHLGASRNTDLLKDLDIIEVENIKDADYILLSAYAEADENLETYNQLFDEAIRLKIPMLTANPDRKVVYGKSYRYCAGFFAEKYEKLGGVVHYFGKPHANIFKLAMNKIRNHIPKDKILMIGDTLEMDILGAKNFEIQSLLVLTGNMGELKKKYLLDAALQKENIFPNFTMDTLKF